ncbi:response regulator transcription factor [Holdemania filiformis]|uniref:response regulator transcription factor n=1 Tax=Holdemania filiformis TaxID=61171 RepID=UPI0026759E04|nr:response regulator transcription factor [Holdemania filiformis]
MIRILLVEDDPDIVSSIVSDLERCGDYWITAVATAQQALQIQAQFDLILLDIMLPDRNGIVLCGQLRKRYACPILFISCLDDSTTIVEALGSGGDDYVVKPFDNQVLHARIQANLRRVRMERQLTQESLRIRCGKAELDCRTETFSYRTYKAPLLPMECRLLRFLMENAGNYYKARELYQEIWGQDSAGDVRTVIVHMHNLRGKIEKSGETPQFIFNVRGKGYTFQPEGL